jgi:hypothetical protein
MNGVKDNVQRKLNYLTRFLDEQLNIISFGDLYYRPSIAHGSAIWF